MRFTKEEINKLVSENIFALTYKKGVSAEEELIESGILNSITVAELAVALEKVFSISFSFMEITKENFCTLGYITNLILKKLNN